MSSGSGIDNARFFYFHHALDQCLLLIKLVVKCFHTEPDVGSIKTLHDDFRRAHPKSFHNLLTYSRGSGRSERQDARTPNLLDDSTEAQVFWTETIAPFANAMGFIHDKQRRMCLLQACKNLFIVELLRSEKQEVKLTFLQALKD